MQLYARDLHGRVVAAARAERQSDHFCLECGSTVRLRGGPHRQSHFYHLVHVESCRLHGKSMAHLQTQQFLESLLGPDHCRLEHPCPTINRIADVVWLPHSMIFEVQCSGISAKEVEERNRDYASLGYTVVWVLHDRQFNRRLVSAAEMALRDRPFYYTDMNPEGVGNVYDQFDLVIEGVRQKRLVPLPVDLSKIGFVKVSGCRLKRLRKRISQWPFFFAGDLVDVCLHQPSDYLESACALEATLPENQPRFFLSKLLRRLVVRPYTALLHAMLEKVSR